MKRFHRYIQTGSVNAPVDDTVAEAKAKKVKTDASCGSAELDDLIEFLS